MSTRTSRLEPESEENQRETRDDTLLPQLEQKEQNPYKHQNQVIGDGARYALHALHALCLVLHSVEGVQTQSEVLLTSFSVKLP